MSQLTLYVTGIAIDGVVKVLTVTTVDSAHNTATTGTAGAPANSAHSGALPHLRAPPCMASFFWTLAGLVLVHCLCFSLF